MYGKEKFIETYKKLVLFYESRNDKNNLRELENLEMEELNFEIAMAYIKTSDFNDLQRIIYKIGNVKNIGLLAYEAFKYYKEIGTIEKFDLFFEKLNLDDKTNFFISEFLIRIYIEMNRFELAEKKLLFLETGKKIEYYFLIAKELKGKEEQNYYIEKAHSVIVGLKTTSEKILALIKLTYLTIEQKSFENRNPYLEEAYHLYLLTENISIDTTKEFIILFRIYKKYDVFLNLLEKKAKFYKEAIKIKEMEAIKTEFVRSINTYLWGDDLEVFEDFMKSYNEVQLKDGELEYEELYELIHQIKRYVNKDVYEKFDKISQNLYDKPNTLYFVNQYLKNLKNI
ncbi:MAG: hypothetical protein JXM74_07900, partial [Fusobacteriaceae bacterium]|nr:hypothetical protein [Fusobacteriaceae bacterium]